MKIPWPQPFEDGDVRQFLQEFEDVAEVAGVKSDRAKLAALRSLLKGRAKATLEAAQEGPEKMEWAAAKDALLAGFSTPADRLEAMERFRQLHLPLNGDPLVFAVNIRKTLSRALPQIDEASKAQLLTTKFLEGVPPAVRSQLQVALIGREMTLEQLADATRGLLRSQPEVAAVEDVAAEDMQQVLLELQKEVAALKVRKNTKNDACFKCGKRGHWKRNCRTPLNRFANKPSYECLFSDGDVVIGAIDRRAIQARVEIDGCREICLIDTGAAVSLIRPRVGATVKKCTTAVRTVGGYTLKVDGVSEHEVRLGDHRVMHTFVVSPDARQTILGADFLCAVEAVVDLKSGSLTLKYGSVPLFRRGADVDQLNVDTVKRIPACDNAVIGETIARYGHLFTTDSDPYGFCDWVEHEIEIDSTKFRPFGPRRIPVNLKSEVDRQVSEMLESGIIEEAESPFNSPVLLVKKANGKFRFCVDFRRLNEITTNKVVAVPAVAEIFDRIQSAKLFTIFDLRSGYWQVPIREIDRDKTAFIVGDKQYRFKRMPFGLSGAPFTFRRLMLKVLGNLPNTAVYGDDIVIFSSDENEHSRNVKAVLENIERAGLRINGPKSQIARQRVTLLGHRIGQGKVEPLPEKLLAIRNLPTPTSKRALRQFLGRVGFYSRFIKGFNEIASPLYQLLQKNRRYTWTESQEKAVEHIRAAIEDGQLTLQLPIIGKPFTVATDASDTGIGAVLKQEDGVIEYASRLLTSAERNYSTTEKECLAIVWALEKWRPYLLGQPFQVETDHKPLEWIKTAKDPRGKLARWALRLQEYEFTIRHIPGKDNHVPDLLSRTERPSESQSSDAEIDAIHLEHDPKRLIDEQGKDQVIASITRALLRGDPPPNTASDAETRSLQRNWKNLQVNSAGLLLYQTATGVWVPVIPKSLRTCFIRECHLLAHTGYVRTYEMLKRRAYWPGMQEDVKQQVSACAKCQLLKTCNRPNDYPNQPLRVQSIGELWSVDVMGPLPTTKNGNQYLLVMTEHFTRWIEAAAIPDQRAKTVCKAVMEHIIAPHGVPEKLLSDQGPCFESEEFGSCMEKFGIKKIRTTPYHPQSNGLTERNNRTIKEWLAAKGGDWEEHLPLVLLAYRASPQKATKQSPFELMYGRLPRLPIDQEIGLWNDNQLRWDDVDELRQTAHDNLRRAQESSQNISTSQCVGRWENFEPGTLVKYRDLRSFGATGPGSRKFRPKWRGPFTVIERKGSVYLIRNDASAHRVHGTHLRRWIEEKIQAEPEQEAAEPVPERSSTRLRREPERLLL